MLSRVWTRFTGFAATHATTIAPHRNGRNAATLGIAHGGGAVRAVSSIWQTTTPGWHFEVTAKTGFIPTMPPIHELPPAFDKLERIMQDMPIMKADGTEGLLGKGLLGETVDRDLPEYDVSGVTDPRLITALFRDYSMLASSYMLEPSHTAMLKTGKYGLVSSSGAVRWRVCEIT
jgi:hypothetical protein